MDKLKRLALFTRVVDTRSFSAAARQLGLAKSAVSKQIRLLEDDVGARLLNRSTRSLSLTEAGEILYRHSSEIIQRTDIAFNELREYQNQPSGTLKVTSPIEFGNSQIVPVIKELNTIYPQLKVELLFEDRITNLIELGADIAIRIGWLQDSNLVAKKLCDAPLVLFAAPEYLARFGTPKNPSELSSHSWIGLSLFESPLKWQFQRSGETRTVHMQSHFTANAIQTVIALAQQGLGISALAKYTIENDLKAGRLIQLLPEYTLEPIGIYAVYPHRDHMPAKLRVFVEFLSKRCNNSSWAVGDSRTSIS